MAGIVHEHFKGSLLAFWWLVGLRHADCDNPENDYGSLFLLSLALAVFFLEPSNI